MKLEHDIIITIKDLITYIAKLKTKQVNLVSLKK